jgi:hypothetical protein
MTTPFGSEGLCLFDLDDNELKVTSYSGFNRPAFVEKVLVLSDGTVAPNTVLQSSSTPSREASLRGISFIGDTEVDAMADLQDSVEEVLFTDLQGTRSVVVTEFSHSGDADNPRVINWSLELVEIDATAS